MKVTNFRDLDVWKLGKEIVLEIYRATALFPEDELYGLVGQMRRASVSIPSNVAEGFNRSAMRRRRNSSGNSSPAHPRHLRRATGRRRPSPS
jgi:hypothetical protein